MSNVFFYLLSAPKFSFQSFPLCFWFCFIFWQMKHHFCWGHNFCVPILMFYMWCSIKMTLLIKHFYLLYLARGFSWKVEVEGGKAKFLNDDFGRRSHTCAAWSHTFFILWVSWPQKAWNLILELSSTKSFLTQKKAIFPKPTLSM